MIVMKNTILSDFVNSEEFEKYGKSLIIELETPDHSKLFIFDKNRTVSISNNIDIHDYLWFSTDDEGDGTLSGAWTDSPFDFKIYSNSSRILIYGLRNIFKVEWKGKLDLGDNPNNIKIITNKDYILRYYQDD